MKPTGIFKGVFQICQYLVEDIVLFAGIEPAQSTRLISPDIKDGVLKQTLHH